MGLFNKRHSERQPESGHRTGRWTAGAPMRKNLHSRNTTFIPKTRKNRVFRLSTGESTLRACLTRIKMAMFLLGVIIVLLLFTFIQPYLPGQRDPIVINNDENGIQIINMKPNSEFWFGTNSIGFCGVMFGAVRAPVCSSAFP